VTPLEHTWPTLRLGEALEQGLRKGGLLRETRLAPTPPAHLAELGRDALERWIQAAVSWLGAGAVSSSTPYRDVEELLRQGGPVLLRIPGNAARFLVVVGAGRRTVRVVGPDLCVHRVSLESVRALLCEELERPHLELVERLLHDADVPPKRRPHARRVLLRQRLGDSALEGVWYLRLPAGSPFWTQIRQARLPRHLGLVATAHASQYLLWLLSWWMIGKGALTGHFDHGWLMAWALILATLIPLRLLATRSQGLLALGLGGLLKQRLLSGALRLHPEEIRHQGAGELLGRVVESEAVESLALQGGFLAITATIELVVAGAVLWAGAGGALHAVLLLGWVALTLLLAWRYVGDRRQWTEARLGMTRDLVERMVGHRTRLSQELRERWHDGEDQALERYFELSRTVDHSTARLRALIPRGWLLVGIAGLAPAFVLTSGHTVDLAIGLGGVLLAYQALLALVASLTHLAGALVAVKQVMPLFLAAARKDVSGHPAFALDAHPDAGASTTPQPLLEASGLAFRYEERSEDVLKDLGLRIFHGDKLLLEGPSGGGKSTLTSILCGLRHPQRGLLFLRGLDRHTLGREAWRRVVAAAPQFHENHVLCETFAFNLLMGRRWPPRHEDLTEAESLCGELGLGPLLARMPAGIMQMVGETGWQLSHGERSRLFLARALLQGADVVVLDESFGALDPEMLARALKATLARAPTLVVVAHP
jgi:ATP-binding cassette subfamily B protein